MNPDSRPILIQQSSRPSAPVPLKDGAFNPRLELAWEGGSGYTEASGSCRDGVFHRPDGRPRLRDPACVQLELRLQRAGSGGTKSERVWSEVMAQICDICGKGPQFGNNISHAHNVSRRRWNVNLQVVKALVNGAPKRLRVCASCIKSGKIAKA